DLSRLRDGVGAVFQQAIQTNSDTRAQRVDLVQQDHHARLTDSVDQGAILPANTAIGRDHGPDKLGKLGFFAARDDGAWPAKSSRNLLCQGRLTNAFWPREIHRAVLFKGHTGNGANVLGPYVIGHDVGDVAGTRPQINATLG